MAQQPVAADASPLIGLAAAGGFDLLHGLFETVVVTAAVRKEIIAGADLPGARELKQAIASGWIKVARNPTGEETFPELDAGEASTLAYAFKRRGRCLVLMDEPLGRARAHPCGIPVTGLAGVLLAAKRAGLVSAIRPYFERLTRSNFRISSEIVQAVLEQAGEASETAQATHARHRRR